MKELPKSVREGLANTKPVSPHPDADLLTAFSEGSLAGREHQRVLEHIGACADCREVVFLAAPEAVNPQGATQGAMTRARWLSWKWMAPAAVIATIAVAAGLYLQQPRVPEVSHEISSPQARQEARTAASQERPPEEQDKQAGAPGATKPSSPQRQVLAGKIVAKKDVPKNEEESRLTERAAAEPATAQVKDEARSAIGMVAQAPAVAVQNSATVPPSQAVPMSQTAENPALATEAPATLAKSRREESGEAKRNSTADTTAEVSATPAFAPHRLKSTPTRTLWRITNAGILERSAGAGWQPALQQSSGKFRAVSVIGAHVWAGTNDGELFHSKDGGNTWERAQLGANGQQVKDAITSISFADLRTGTVKTASGDTWTTTDEGRSWKRQ